LGLAAALLGGALVPGALAPAAACACGGVITPGHAAKVQQEAAALTWDGERESVLLRLSLASDAEHAALVVPTPSPATVSAGAAATFGELARLSAPEYVVRTEWFSWPEDGDTAAAAPGAAPMVLDQVRLGPLEATTLRGGDLAGLRRWLGDNGYPLRPEVGASLAPYVREGWSFVAVRLTGERPLSGALDPVRLDFATDRPIYPMRMSAAAATPQSVLLHVLGEHRVVRADPDAAHQDSAVEFAGRLSSGASDDPFVTAAMAEGRDYLTTLRVRVDDPAAITADWTFTAAAEDTGHRERVVRVDRVTIGGLPAGYLVLGAASLAAVVVAVAVVRVTRAGPED
ncbi:DUF2330 domain-containing protein, partial [Nocardia farcinica]|uniref:DUF2330 domain-containing protein n=1 Tax=Nocardia farcinica TaxID=37329 RepID=UPI0032B00350